LNELSMQRNVKKGKGHRKQGTFSAASLKGRGWGWGLAALTSGNHEVLASEAQQISQNLI
ncbi:MAG: hypothetical protein IJ613_02940, partial [Muribaculaceae bacterium]|nr:hypothetical protein [Muribaculaceae bacterium]